MHTSGIHISAALLRSAGTFTAVLFLLPDVSGCTKSNADKTNAIVMDKSGYTKVVHKPVGNPPYALPINGCPAGWALTKFFLEPDKSRQASCIHSGDKDGVEIDYLLPGEKVTGVDQSKIVNNP